MTFIGQQVWSVGRYRGLALLVLLVGIAMPGRLGAAPSPVLADLHRQAAALERQHDWLEACRVYDEILHRDRGQADARQGYQRCLRCVHMARRHRDPLYRQAIARLTAQQALDLYEQVLHTVSAVYVDRRRARVDVLFRHGVRELELALEEPYFQREYLPGVSAAVLSTFRLHLRLWHEENVSSRTEARAQALALIRTAQQDGVVTQSSLRAVLVLEMACGACNGLDEYTLFLTPGYNSEVQATLQGKLVSVGIDLRTPVEPSSMTMQRLGGLEILRVYPRSPAQEKGLLRHDRLLSINGQSVNGMAPEEAAEKLRGGAGTLVEVEVITPGTMVSRTLKLRRRPVVVPSVNYELLTLYGDNGEMIPLGMLRISGFQESTVQEVKEALASLQTEGMRVLVLDLRGNPGGYFKAAVQVAELFLGEGVIVISQSQLPEYNRPFRADIPNPLHVPMVVLIDGDTASAAEVLAGALKEQRRATLLGQTTFGKGSIQAIVPLDRAPLERTPSGIRITVARLFSPSRQPYTGQGVSPDVVLDPEGEAIQAEARRLLLSLLKPMEPMGLPR
jgi:carboxyl-terminal processing protease